jgi:hypothetical protein
LLERRGHFCGLRHRLSKERRRTTGQTDLKAAKKVHKGFLDALAAERQGHTPLPAPLAARVTVGELLDQLEADNPAARREVVGAGEVSRGARPDAVR